SHKGFLEKGFLLAVRDNLRSQAFKRGGSTISMQLVKNIFLSHQKTLGRKLEEAILVWLIENLRLTTKERILELYLNLIEWGPDVYGITEAAQFYFNKKPSQLDLNESIFLALIIPKPRYFYWYFTENAELKDITIQYYVFLTTHMLRNKRITQQEFDNLIPNIRLAPKALKHLKLKETPVLEGEEPLLPMLPPLETF
ncbi:MAG: transglycosylase domain-containing protein, partial [Bacteroidia bacterium]|nr:transglycosylase domain-containing protein [Bacteroidia bacterium]